MVLESPGPWVEPYQSATPKLDPTAFIHPRAVIIGDVLVGPQSSVWPNTTLRGDDGTIWIGARTSIQDGTVIHATERLSENRIGDQVTVGHNCTIHGATIGSDCIIGMGSILLDNVVVGDHCLIGAGTLLTQGTKIPPYSLVLGSPGKVVRRLSDEQVSWIEYSWKRYVEQAAIYNARHQNATAERDDTP